MGISDLIDIGIISLLIYLILIWFKARKANYIIFGIIVIGAVYLLARQFNLVLTTSLLHGFFAVFVIALIVIFQEELRYFFEQIPEKLKNSFETTSTKFSSLFSKGNDRIKDDEQYSYLEDIDIISSALNDFSLNKIGAIIVLPGINTINRYLNGGFELNGKLSLPLLKSIFDPNSVGHDGAAVIKSGCVTKFACHLPLSKNFLKIQTQGTRHAAALGLSELTDALCLVASEEQGAISYSRYGDIKKIDKDKLKTVLRNYFEEINPSEKERKWYRLATRNIKEKAIAVLLAIILWFVFVQESMLVYRSFTIPVKHTNLPEELEITEINPKGISVTFIAPRRDFFFLNENEIKAILKIPKPETGKQKINISDSDISFPQDLILEDIEPRQIIITIEKNE